jgi:chaperonin cofactor prefoldin
LGNVVAEIDNLRSDLKGELETIRSRIEDVQQQQERAEVELMRLMRSLPNHLVKKLEAGLTLQIVQIALLAVIAFLLWR